MKYLYIKILILLAILIPPTLVIESEAAGSPFSFEIFGAHSNDTARYFPKTGYLCVMNSFDGGYTYLSKTVFPKNLNLTGYKNIKGTYLTVRLDKRQSKYSPKLNHNWKLSEYNYTYNADNQTSPYTPKAFESVVLNECNNNKISSLLLKYRKQKRNIYPIYE